MGVSRVLGLGSKLLAPPLCDPRTGFLVFLAPAATIYKRSSPTPNSATHEAVTDARSNRQPESISYFLEQA